MDSGIDGKRNLLRVVPPCATQSKSGCLCPALIAAPTGPPTRSTPVAHCRALVVLRAIRSSVSRRLQAANLRAEFGICKTIRQTTFERAKCTKESHKTHDRYRAGTTLVDWNSAK